jgi:prepilin peptidase CpaA
MFLLGATIIAAFFIHRVAKATAIRQMVPDWESWTRREFPMGMALAPSLVFYLLIAFAQG